MKNWRLFIFVVAAILGAAASLPSFLNAQNAPKINLGLDLQGGLYMLLGVNTNEAVANKIKSLSSGVNAFAEQNNILIDGLAFDETSLKFDLLDGAAKGKLDGYFKDITGITIAQDNERYEIRLTAEEAALVKNSSVSQAVETIRNRLDQFGLSEPTVAQQGEDKILVELPGVKTDAEEQRARSLIAQSAHLQMMAIDERNNARAMVMTEAEARAAGSIVLPDVYNPNEKYVVKRLPILDGERLTDARVGFDPQTNQPLIHFSLDGAGAKIFGDFTEKNKGKRLAIVLDDKVYSAPVIRERIGGGSGQISGSFTMQTAADLAIALRSGSLSASVDMQEKRSVGPSLGADSIKASAIALISGFLAVAAFMILYYRIAGLISVAALFVNLFMIVAIMALFGATLTLPGMVGIVLTIGMAVDANVIINERIKELLYEGKGVLKAIEQGYANAFSAILDANITTLIAAIALYAYGTGPIKGFAVTLSVGILCSMLTAIVGTRGIFEAISARIARGKIECYFHVPKKANQ
ncbi:MAG: protein translocase subunit SecD [Helicobacteraceae bacterium]|jgi:preprotein translocase subunit SecD|nr:protein translocase subunit SecD [Helicobacteraceae bacterium]